MIGSMKKVQALLNKPLVPVLFFLGGVTYDSLTLTRIDGLFDNLLLLLYVSLLGTLIILTGRIQMGQLWGPHPIASTPWWTIPNLLRRAQPYYVPALQFLFGGLFSAYAIVYFQSASWNTSAIFLGVVVIMLIANEFLRNRLSSLKLLVMLYALVTFSFFTFFLPVLTGIMNTGMFVMGAVLSAAVVLRVVYLTFQGVANQSAWSPILTSLPAIGMVGILTSFYFLNWIPPVPLSLKFAGMYHKVEKSHGTYQLTFEEGSWYQFWKRSDDIFRGEGPVYCFTSVFAPVSLDTTIYHHWQYRPPRSEDDQHERPFSTTDRIPIKISGGREEGYRSYTVKQRVMPGEWRVDVETEDGRLISRVAFQVEEEEAPVMETITY